MNRRRLRIAGWSVLGLTAMLVGLVLLLRSPWLGDWLARTVEGLASAALGEDVEIGRLTIEPARRRVRLEGVVITHRSDRPEHDGQTIVAVEAVAAELGIRDWRPIARRIEVERPVVHLHLDPDGLREFRSASLGSEDKARKQAPARLPWNELWLRGGRFRLTRGDLQLEAAGIDLSPEAEPGRLRLDLDALQVSRGGWSQQARGIALSGLLVTPDRLVVPWLEIEFPLASLEGDIAMQRDGPLKGDLSARIALAELGGLLPPEWRLEGQAQADIELGGRLDSPALEGALLLDDASAWKRQGEKEKPILDLGDLRAAFELADRRLDVGPVTARWASGDLRLSGGLDVLSGGFSVAASGEGLSLGEAFRLTGVSAAPWVDMETDIELQAAGTLDPLILAGSADIAGRRLLVGSGPVDRSSRILDMDSVNALIEVRLQDQDLLLAARRIATTRSAGSATARLDLGRGGGLVLDVDLEQVALDELWPLGGLDPEGRLSLQGRLAGPWSGMRLDGDLVAQDLGLVGYHIADHLESPLESPDLKRLIFPAAVGRLGQSELQGQVEVDLGRSPTGFDLRLLLSEARISDLVSIVGEVPGLEGQVDGALSMQGPIGALDGEIALQLSRVDLFGEGFERGAAVAWMRQGRLTVERLGIERQEGRESLLARGSIEPDGRLNLELRSGLFTLSALHSLSEIQADLGGLLALDARIGGTVRQPEPHGRLALRQTRLGGREFADSTVLFDTEGEVLSFYGTLAGRDLAVEGTLQLGGEAAWAVQAELEDFPAHAFYPQTPDGTPVHALLSGRLQASGLLGTPGRPFTLSAETSKVAVDWGTHQLRSIGPWQLRLGPELFSLSGLELQGGQTRVDFGGARTSSGELQLAGGGTVDLDLLRAFVPGLRSAQGTAEIDLDVSGRPGGLQPEVEARIADGRFRADWLPEPVEAVDARITGASTGYTLAPSSARVGGGAMELGGRIDARNWIPTRYDLYLILKDARVQWFDWLPPVNGDAALSFNGPAEDPLLSGKVTVRDMLFADRIDWEDAVVSLRGEHLAGAASDPSQDLFSFDIQFSSDQTVRVRNNLGDLVASGDLRLVGDTARPGLVGDIRAVPGGRVYLKEREFELLRGELHFVEPYTFDPELDIALQTRVRTREEDYAIDYRISGPWSDWRADSTSDPALPQADINALLLFGMTRDELERYGGAFSALALEGGDMLASKFGLVETLGQGIYGIEILRPERIDLVSGVTERGSSTISSELRILAEKDLDQATLILEQNISRLSDTYVGLERRLANRLYLRGFWAREQVGRRLQTGGAWGMDFNLRWELD